MHDFLRAVQPLFYPAMNNTRTSLFSFEGSSAQDVSLAANLPAAPELAKTSIVHPREHVRYAILPGPAWQEMNSLLK